MVLPVWAQPLLGSMGWSHLAFSGTLLKAAFLLADFSPPVTLLAGISFLALSSMVCPQLTLLLPSSPLLLLSRPAGAWQGILPVSCFD